jgi:hypothetical protein
VPHIRRVIPQDADGIGELHAHGWWEAYLGLTPTTYLNALSVPQRVAGWTRTLQTPKRSGIRVVERAGDLTGYAWTQKLRGAGVPAVMG